MGLRCIRHHSSDSCFWVWKARISPRGVVSGQDKERPATEIEARTDLTNAYIARTALHPRSPPPNITWKHRRRREAATTACERSFRAWRHPFSKSIPDAPVAVQARDPVIFCYLRSRLVLPKPVAGFLSGAGAVGLTLEITASSGSGFFTA